MRSAHSTVVAGVSTVVFTLMAILAVVLSDLSDRWLPHGAGASAAITLDITDSGLGDAEAFAQLGALSDELGLGLVKLAGDLSGEEFGQVIVELGADRALPDRIARFGDIPDAEVRGPESLEHSRAGGRYLITGDDSRIEELQAWLSARQIEHTSSTDDPGYDAVLRIIVTQQAFVISLVATIVLLIAVVVYWLAVRSRQRALRVLAGARPLRVIAEDLAGLLGPIALAAIVVHAAAGAYVAAAHGTVFLPYFASTLALLQGLIIVAAVGTAVLLSLLSWPSSAVLARREPAVRRHRHAATSLKAVTFVLVIATIAPAYGAVRDAMAAAAEQAQWRLLGDQVSLVFVTGESEQEFDELKGPVAEVALRAEQADAVSLSYSWTSDYLGQSAEEESRYGDLALVNQQWLDIVDADAAEQTAVSFDQLPDSMRDFLIPSLEIWQRDRDADVSALLHRLTFRQYAGEVALPVVHGGSGELLFLDRVVLVVVPELTVLNEDFLASVATSANLVFTGVGRTEELVAEAGLLGSVRVQHIAEDGLLRAQFSAHFAWMQGISLLALLAAMAISAAVGSVIAALLDMRRDFQLRLAGASSVRIISRRVAPEWAFGLTLVAIAVTVLLARGSPGAPLILAAGGLGLATSALCHAAARRWTFRAVAGRTL